ncbi:N-acetyltransferase family protein [Acidovorax sp. NCPPB 2350]|nr:N-acetyltransferase family protein [Acidovorax sp. NCPPB 2350]
MTHDLPPPIPARPPLRPIPAGDHHLPAIRGLYAPYVLHARCSFEEEVPSVNEMGLRLRAVRAAGLPWLVVMEDGELLGYAYAVRYRARAAYRGTVESSVYVGAGHHGRGIGRLLLDAVIDECARAGYEQMVAVVGDSANTGSLRLHLRAGFHEVGVLRGVGRKFGVALDTVIMQRALCPRPE